MLCLCEPEGPQAATTAPDVTGRALGDPDFGQITDKEPRYSVSAQPFRHHIVTIGGIPFIPIYVTCI